MRILVTNDDGIHSPGLRLLAESASRFGEVRVVAPEIEQSAAAHAVTPSRPLSHRRIRLGSFDAYRVNGTPADCVGVGMFIWGNVDVVVSGLNLGLNLGNSMWHSGTIAAARQASLLGARGIALSAPDTADDPSYEGFLPHVHAALETVLALPRLRLLNVNIPSSPRGVTFTRQSVRHYDGRLELSHDAEGRDIYWFVTRPVEAAEPGTDRWAIEHDLVSITPLRLDLSDQQALAELLAGHPAPAPGT
jgi:5'-nucleotidase